MTVQWSQRCCPPVASTLGYNKPCYINLSVFCLAGELLMSRMQARTPGHQRSLNANLMQHLLMSGLDVEVHSTVEACYPQAEFGRDPGQKCKQLPDSHRAAKHKGWRPELSTTKKIQSEWWSKMLKILIKMHHIIGTLVTNESGEYIDLGVVRYLVLEASRSSSSVWHLKMTFRSKI